MFSSLKEEEQVGRKWPLVYNNEAGFLGSPDSVFCFSFPPWKLRWISFYAVILLAVTFPYS